MATRLQPRAYRASGRRWRTARARRWRWRAGAAKATPNVAPRCARRPRRGARRGTARISSKTMSALSAGQAGQGDGELVAAESADDRARRQRTGERARSRPTRTGRPPPGRAPRSAVPKPVEVGAGSHGDRVGADGEVNGGRRSSSVSRTGNVAVTDQSVLPNDVVCRQRSDAADKAPSMAGRAGRLSRTRRSGTRPR